MALIRPSAICSRNLFDNVFKRYNARLELLDLDLMVELSLHEALFPVFGGRIHTLYGSLSNAVASAVMAINCATDAPRTAGPNRLALNMAAVQEESLHAVPRDLLEAASGGDASDFTPSHTRLPR